MVGLAGGGIAYASIPDSSGVIHGCYKTENGQLRVINVPGKTCTPGETPLNWNQTGPNGARGPTGALGPTGPNLSGLFETLTTTDFLINGGQTLSVSASCTGARLPLVGSVVPGTETKLLTRLSYPGGGSWNAVVENQDTNSNTFRLTFTCVDPAAVTEVQAH